MKKPARKPTKPKPFKIGTMLRCDLEGAGEDEFFMGVSLDPENQMIGFDSKEARRLASWLTRFADWAEARKEIEG